MKNFFFNKKSILFSCFFIFFLLPSSNFAHQNRAFWGETGHRIIGHIAEQYLSKKAKKAIKEILGNESVAMASTWADFMKSDSVTNAQTSAWHYVNIPDGQTYAQMQKNPKGDVLEAIDRLVKDLENKETSLEKKRFALRFLIHLIGDLHQPMHVGRAEDLGGNKIKVKWFGRETNLHRLWDSDLIEHQSLSYTEFSQAINSPSKEQIKLWQSTDHYAWAEESQVLAQKLYKSVKENESLGYRYAYDFDETLKMRLLQGGVRLAAVLNKTLK